MLKQWLLYVGSVLLGLAVVGGLLGAFILALLYPTLPSLESLTDYQPKIPLRIVSAEGDPLGEFGEERRAVVTIAEVPDVMIKAIYKMHNIFACHKAHLKVKLCMFWLPVCS